MNRFNVHILFAVFYIILSMVDSYTTSFAIGRSENLFYELNPKVIDTSFIGIFFSQIKILPLYLLFIFISLGYDLMPKGWLSLFGMDKMSRLDKLFMKIPGAASITVLFLMAFGCVNNLFVIFQVGSIVDFILSFLFNDSDLRVAFFPIFTLLLFIAIIPVSIVAVTKIRSQLIEG